MKAKLDFIVVGAAKSGTTALYEYLIQDKRFFIPDIKECRFFSEVYKKKNLGLGAERFQISGIKTHDEYCKIFNKEKVSGDISNDYLYYFEDSIKNIRRYVGNEVKIIIILRNPIFRALSNYNHHIREGWENLSFSESIKKESERINQGWSWPYHYTNASKYSKAVQEFKRNFKKVHIIFYEEFGDVKEMLPSIYNFLELGLPKASFKDLKSNQSGIPRSKFLHNIIMSDSSWKEYTKKFFRFFSVLNFLKNILLFIKKINIRHNTSIEKSELYKYRYIFEEDISELERILDRKIDFWD